MPLNEMFDEKNYKILPFLEKRNIPSKASYSSKIIPAMGRRGAGQAGVAMTPRLSPVTSAVAMKSGKRSGYYTPTTKFQSRAGSTLNARLRTLGTSSIPPSRRNSYNQMAPSAKPSIDLDNVKLKSAGKVLKGTSESVLDTYDIIEPAKSPSFPLAAKLQEMPFDDVKKLRVTVQFIEFSEPFNCSMEDVANPLFDNGSMSSTLLVAGPEAEVHPENMSAKAMKRLEYVFKVAEERDGPLAYDTFRNVLQAVLGHRVPEKELKMMFMKIDTNCDETVSWSEYLSFILCELQKQDLMNSTKHDNPLPDEISKTIYSRHHNFINRIRFTPALLNRGSRNEKWDKKTGKYVSMSLDGTVCFWTPDMECTRVINLQKSKASAPIYCTDMVTMANVNYIAVSTSDSDIRFYDLSGWYRYELVLVIHHLSYLPLCMNYWFDEKHMNKELSAPHKGDNFSTNSEWIRVPGYEMTLSLYPSVLSAYLIGARLFWGDAGGNVYILTFWKCLAGGPFGNVSFNKRITLAQLLSDIHYGQKNRYHVQKLRRLHLDWVRAIQYLPDLDVVVSSCGETTTALACTALQDLKSKYFIVSKGVICFDYSTKQNILVSGGIEQNVRGWNPYINTGPIFRLKGTNAVMHLMVNNERDLCISISLDKNVCIFSLKDQNLVQMIPPRSFPKMIGQKPITSAYFNNDTQVLVVGTTDLSVFLPDLEKEVSMKSNTHDSHLCAVLFNPLYDLVVSGCNGSTICVWDLRNGEKRLMFDKAHAITVYNKEVVIDMTAMAFDYTMRRLVTGGRDGTVKVWNFHNGDCLRMMETEGSMEIGLMVVLSMIGAGGCILNLIQLVYIIRRIRNKKKLAMDYVLISLSLSDLYQSTATIASSVYLYGNEFDWKGLGVHSNSLCKLTSIGTVVARSVGLYSMCIIAVTRLIAIKWPLILEKVKWKTTLRNQIDFALIWIIVICFSVPTAIFANTDLWALKPNMTLLSQNPNHYQPVYINESDSCVDYAQFCTVSKHGSDGAVLEKLYWYLSVVLFLALPQAVLSICYSLITVTLLKRRQQRKTTFESADPAFIALTNKRDREAITSSILGGVYVVLNLPILVYSVFDPLPHNSVKGYDSIRSVLLTVATLTVITNPCIYTFFTPSFIRQEKHCFYTLYYHFLSISRKTDSNSEPQELPKEISSDI